MRLLTIVIVLLILPFAMIGQVMEAFREQLRQERQKNGFGASWFNPAVFFPLAR
jgi:hypothetical protein